MLRSRVETLHILADLFILAAALYLSSVIRRAIDIGLPAPVETFIPQPPLYLIVLLVWMLIFSQNNVYIHHFGEKFRFRLFNVIKSHIIAAFLFFGVLYLTFRDFSRFQAFYFIVLSGVGLVGFRLIYQLLWRVFYDREVRRFHVLILGVNENARQLQARIRRNPRNHLSLVGFVRSPFDDDKPRPELDGQILGDMDNLLEIVQKHDVDEVVIVPQWYSRQISDQISDILYRLQRFPVNVRLAPDYSEVSFFQVVTENFEGLPLIGLRTSIFTPTQRLLKRILDLAIAVPIVAIGSPLLGAIALAIKLDSSGPILFGQRRVGIHGNEFHMYKFRSMYDKLDQKHFDENQLNIMKRPDDPRVTRVGRFLRRTSLDELPQLFNVIKGDMSIVGPRPELPSRVQEYEWWQYKRFEVPQGMTGWWQINGRANRPMHLNTEDDLYYIQNYSLLLDLQILFRTVRVVLTGEGAF
jgi:exopolysaccharide biosynthesis polyprenyl glycosylphosphotransferase